MSFTSSPTSQQLPASHNNSPINAVRGITQSHQPDGRNLSSCTHVLNIIGRRPRWTWRETEPWPRKCPNELLVGSHDFFGALRCPLNYLGGSCMSIRGRFLRMVQWMVSDF